MFETSMARVGTAHPEISFIYWPKAVLRTR